MLIKPPIDVFILTKPKGDDWPFVSSAVQTLNEIFLLEALKGEINIITDDRKLNTNSIIFSIGGDGTMLQAMRLAASKRATAYGINLGNVGFLTDYTYSVAHTEKFIELIVDLLDEVRKTWYDTEINHRDL